MPNAAPAFLLEVKRALFVTAETDIQFNDGMIRSIAIDKPSELKVVSELTVAAVQIVLEIPSRALKIFSNRRENMEALIEVNMDLISTLEAYNAARGVNPVPREQLGQPGTNLIFGRSSGDDGFSTSRTPAVDRMAECLNDPASQQYEDPVDFCRQVVRDNL
jgi:hypothetical protein